MADNILGLTFDCDPHGLAAEENIRRIHVELENRCRAFLKDLLLVYQDPAWLKFAVDRLFRIVRETVDEAPGTMGPFHVRRRASYTSEAARSHVHGHTPRGAL